MEKQAVERKRVGSCLEGVEYFALSVVTFVTIAKVIQAVVERERIRYLNQKIDIGPVRRDM
jgi:hypothetical protein